MSAHLSPAPIARGVILTAPYVVMSVKLAWRRFRRAYKLALRDEVSRRNLRTLDDRMLSDIGVSRAQAEFESRRSLWTLPYSA